MSQKLTRFFHPVLLSKTLGKKPIPIQIGEEKIVLFRNTKNEPVALEDQCAHRFTPLSEGTVKEGRITCPYHGWSFNENGQGQRPGSNHKPHCNIRSFQVIEKYNYLWVADQSANPQTIPDFKESEWTFLDSYSFTFDAPLHVVLDNFSEDEHFPFVHKIFGWDESGVDQVEHTSELKGNQIHVQYWGPQRSFPGMRLLLAKPGQYLDNRWVSEFDPVRTVYVTHLTDKNKKLDAPGYNKIAIYFVPYGKNQTKLHVFQFVKFQNKFWLKILPLLKPTYVRLVKNDLNQDAIFTKKLSHIPYSLKDMALGPYDKPLVYNRKLLEKVYYGTTETKTTESSTLDI